MFCDFFFEEQESFFAAGSVKNSGELIFGFAAGV
jgi:hypothetical protein